MFPTRIDREEAHPDTFANDATGGQPALAVVLTWEIIRFNKLIEVVSGGWVVGGVWNLFDDPQQNCLGRFEAVMIRVELLSCRFVGGCFWHDPDCFCFNFLVRMDRYGQAPKNC